MLFRVVKWIVLIGGAVLLFQTTLFWYWVIGLSLIGVILHFVYRWNTHGWTRPWGGWTDVEAAQ